MATATQHVQATERRHGEPVPAVLTIYQADVTVGGARGTAYSFDPIPDAYSEAIDGTGPRLNVIGSWSSVVIKVKVPAGATWHIRDGEAFVRAEEAYNAKYIAESLRGCGDRPTWEGFRRA